MRLSAERWFISYFSEKKLLVVKNTMFLQKALSIWRSETNKKKNVVFLDRHKDRFMVNIAIRQLMQC